MEVYEVYHYRTATDQLVTIEENERGYKATWELKEGGTDSERFKLEEYNFHGVKAVLEKMLGPLKEVREGTPEDVCSALAPMLSQLNLGSCSEDEYGKMVWMLAQVRLEVKR